MSKKITKPFVAILSAIVAFFASTGVTHAICPVCTVAVGSGLVLSRELGIDDTISGIWVGALTVSLIMWTINWLNSRKIKFLGRKPLVAVIYIALTIVPLYWFKVDGYPLIGRPGNIIWGYDKLLTGIVFGAILFFGGASLYQYLKVKNNNHAHFPFEKIALTVGPLIILSIIFYFITR